MTSAHDESPEPRDVWPAIVLTAGLGTRLRPLSLLRAKPALPVAGVPLIGRILGWLSASGVGSAVLNLHHLPSTITAVVGDGRDFGVQVRYSWEPTILGSAGGPARALPLIGADQFFIINGDTLTDVSLAALAADHRRSGAKVTLALVPNPDPLHYGGVTVDGEGQLVGFTPRGPANTGLHSIGVQAVDADVFAPLDPDVPAESFSGIYRDLMARCPGCVRAFVSHAAFRDIGTAADYLDTCVDIARIEASAPSLIDGGTTVADSAVISNCVVWDDVRVGQGATLAWSIVASGARIPGGARFEQSVVRPRDRRPAEPGEQVVGDLLVSRIGTRRSASN